MTRTGSNGWYEGNSHTALLSAVHAVRFKEIDLEKEKNMADVLNQLLENGADPNFKYLRGGWNHAESYCLASDLLPLLCNMKDAKMRQDLLKNFMANGLKVNPPERHGRDKSRWARGSMNYPIFRMMSQFSSQTDPEQRQADEEFIKAVIECGADVNSAEWRWHIEYGNDDYGVYGQEE